MAVITPEVKLVAYTSNPVEKIVEAAAVCWKSTPRENMLKHLAEINHMAPFKFAHFTFDISGVSRAFSHQRVRKQIGDDKLQESQRHVVYEEGFDYRIPPTIERDPEAKRMFETTMQDIHTAYQSLLLLGIPTEDARFVLPNACGTKLRVVSSVLSLIDESKERLCSCAQWEYQKIMQKQKALVSEVEPIIASLMQPKCKWLGYCPESKDRHNKCKRMPHKSSLGIKGLFDE